MNLQPVSSADIQFECAGCAAFIILTGAARGLSAQSIRAVDQALEYWRHDPSISRIVIASDQEGLFCTGADYHWLYEQGEAQRTDLQLEYSRVLCGLCARLATCPKPVVVALDGVMADSGAALFLHASHRLIGDRASYYISAPRLGLVLEGGTSRILSRLPAGQGQALALAGKTLEASDLAATQLATHKTDSRQIARLILALSHPDPISAIFEDMQIAQTDKSDGPDASFIASCFSAPDVISIILALEGIRGPAQTQAEDLARAMRAGSPMAMTLIFEQLRRGPTLSLEETLRMDYRLMSHIYGTSDCQRGLEAHIQGKTQTPVWDPSLLGEVSQQTVKDRCSHARNKELEQAA